jgi:hypothetical protein
VSHFELTKGHLSGTFDHMTPRDFDIAERIVHVDNQGKRTVIKDRLRAAVDAHGSPELKGKSDGILQDMDNLGRALGGPPLAEALEKSLCAVCGRKVDEKSNFVDELSRCEWRVSHMCQSCQDDVFAEPEK